MNMLWEHRLPLARGAAGSVGDIFCHDGMAFAVVDENACTRWHVAAFDMQGTPADMRRESLIRARGYAFSSGMLLAQGLTGTCLYSLPDLRETPLPFSADAVSRWNFPRPAPAEGVPYFVAAGFRDGGDARLAAFSRSGRLLWRQELAAFPQVDCLLLTDRFVVAGSRSRQNGATSLFILSVTGERLKVITLDSRYEDKLFRTLGGRLSVYLPEKTADALENDRQLHRKIDGDQGGDLRQRDGILVLECHKQQRCKAVDHCLNDVGHKAGIHRFLVGWFHKAPSLR